MKLAVVVLLLSACSLSEEQEARVGVDLEVVDVAPDGVVRDLRGELADVGELPADDAAAESQLRAVLPTVLKPFRLHDSDLVIRKIVATGPDALETTRHFRYRQVHEGLDVVGGDLVVHVDSKGTIFEINGTARSDLPPPSASVSERDALDIVAQDERFADLHVQGQRLVYLQTEDSVARVAYEVIVEGDHGADPVRDKVYVDGNTGAVLAIHPMIQTLRNRLVNTANYGTGLPGTFRRGEGQIATSDPDVDAAYDNTGATYDAFMSFFGRDSYDYQGASLTSTVHYGNQYCNAYWSGAQMVYGDGDPAQSCAPLARAVDVTGHELGHAITENDSDLIVSGEAGGLNEAMSDVFGAFVEAFVDGGKTGTLVVTADTFTVAEDVMTPALRWMCDPAKDGASADFYTNAVPGMDVHYSAGVADLAFCLLVQGGMHPRGKSSIHVSGIGMAKAIRVFYEANRLFLVSTSSFLAARNATMQTATMLGLTTAEQVSVQNAWAAVGVGTPAAEPPPAIVLASGVPVTNLSGGSFSETIFSIVATTGTAKLNVAITGGSGDADLYVRLGDSPTTQFYDCRPYLSGNSEVCAFTPPQAGTYYVSVRGYTAYSGVSLTATLLDDGVPVLRNEAIVSGIAGASGSQQYWKINSVRDGATLQVGINGGAGDADLYVRRGALPTLTSYDCRPYVTGNTEHCIVEESAGSTYYIMVRGRSAFSGVTLKATY